MKLNVLYLVVLCVNCAFAIVPAKKSTSDELKNDLKPKREAALLSGSSYHGPSYKYLPPTSSASAGGYDSYSSGHHGSYAEAGAYDFGSASSANGHGFEQLDTSAPKVETYIVQTKPAYNNQVGPHSSEGYRYTGSSSAFSGGYSGHQSGFNSGYSHGHGAVHKVKAIVIPSRGFSAGSHGGSGYNRFGGSGSAFGHSKVLSGLSGGSHIFSGSSSNHIADSYAGNSYTSKHAGFGSGYSGAHSLGIGASSGGHGLQSFNHGSSIPVQSLEASYRETGYSGNQKGYSYETPVSLHSHGDHGIPSNSYGVPSNSYGVPSNSYGVPINDLSPPYRVGEAASLNIQQPPSYAAGHKGLGHFGYASSKPQALHTDFVDSNNYENSYLNHATHSDEKAPFKPSLFLGSSHDGDKAISSEYGAPAPSNGISAQYLQPPTSDGYDYPSPSALYGAPNHAHTEVDQGQLQEPELTYLPPSQQQSSYGPPATPVDSYLPPHH